MSEPENGHGAMEGSPQAPKAVIVLSLNHDMTVGVTFPNDEIITRFLLDKGVDAIRDMLRARNAPLITPAGGMGGAGVQQAPRGLLGRIRPNLG